MKTATRLFTLTALLLGSSLAMAQGRDRGHSHGVQGRMVFDTRYHHDHYYPAPGFFAPGLPRGSVSIGYGPGRYWYGGGVWYRPYNSGFRVILPPIGIFVPVLPGAYVSLSIGGLPYYYANGVYYSSAPGGYTVVAPPPQADRAEPVQTFAPPKPDPIVYPRNGQTAEQTESDRQECNRWATTQPAAMNEASVFNRAVDACMDGRGYTVR
ncbi:hypothetical protein BH11PSE10_BH11PSE10_16250 [soil metagenome]